MTDCWLTCGEVSAVRACRGEFTLGKESPRCVDEVCTIALNVCTIASRAMAVQWSPHSILAFTMKHEHVLMQNTWRRCVDIRRDPSRRATRSVYHCTVCTIASTSFPLHWSPSAPRHDCERDEAQ